MSKIAEAEIRFKRLQKDSDDKQKARNQYETDQKAILEKTERLRALRLAKEAAEAKATVSNKPVAKSVFRKKMPAMCSS
jgi:hypothetical protein